MQLAVSKPSHVVLHNNSPLEKPCEAHVSPFKSPPSQTSESLAKPSPHSSFIQAGVANTFVELHSWLAQLLNHANQNIKKTILITFCFIISPRQPTISPSPDFSGGYLIVTFSEHPRILFFLPRIGLSPLII